MTETLKCRWSDEPLKAAHPGDETLDAHPEAGVGDRSVAAKIQIPLELCGRQVMFFQALKQQVEFVDALAAADHFTKAFRGDEVGP